MISSVALELCIGYPGKQRRGRVKIGTKARALVR